MQTGAEERGDRSLDRRRRTATESCLLWLFEKVSVCEVRVDPASCFVQAMLAQPKRPRAGLISRQGEPVGNLRLYHEKE